MRTSESVFDPHVMRAVAGEALALLRQQEEGTDETGQRARWIAALEALAAGSPQAVPQDADVMAEVTAYLELLAQSSVSPFLDEDDWVGEGTVGRPNPVDASGVLRDGPYGEQGGTYDRDASTEAGEELRVAPPAPVASTVSAPGTPATPPRVSEQDGPASDEVDDIARMEQVLQRLEAMRAQSSGTVAAGADGSASDAQLPELLELKKNIQRADMEVQAAQEEVSAHELNVLGSAYAREAMHAATRQIDVDMQRTHLDERRLEVSETDSARRHELELRRLDLELHRLETQRYQHHREMTMRERTAEVDGDRAERESEAQLAASARAHTTIQLTASACAITATSWLTLPGVGAGISLLSLSPLLAVLVALILLTAMALSRTRAVRPQEGPDRALSWTDGVRAVPLLPVAALLITTSAVFAFISVLTPREQRKQLHGYAHRTLQTAERLLLGR
ncbi:hypothetical protein OG806_49850 [Streptomyces sp. NBC_00882]|uniref:hypothetical protein n=1 Tax=Streptomyces sp. NBC_00882 TaxID=2975856 RepID=UPI0038649EE0|nr:hypothetical protein OG806_00095 [Streptomyces sp. NBC_00882]WSZ36922.1 hypothetical protein OG806_49850 [Streptomyces sp. NBC_00882]